MRPLDRLDPKLARVALHLVAAALAFGVIDLLVLGAGGWIVSMLPAPDPPVPFPELGSRGRLLMLVNALLKAATATPWRAALTTVGVVGAGLKLGLVVAALRRAGRPEAPMAPVLAAGLVGLLCSAMNLVGSMWLTVVIGRRGTGALAELSMATSTATMASTLVGWLAAGLVVVALYRRASADQAASPEPVTDGAGAPERGTDGAGARLRDPGAGSG